MIKAYSLLKPLTAQLMEEIRAYGILEVSLEQYQTNALEYVSYS